MHSVHPQAIVSSVFPQMSMADVLGKHHAETRSYKRFGYGALASLLGLLASLSIMAGSDEPALMHYGRALQFLTFTYAVLVVALGLIAFAHLLRVGVLEVEMDRREIDRG